MTEVIDQPPPIATDRRPAWDIVQVFMREMPRTNGYGHVHELVLADMAERDKVGRARYGVPLTAGNGRDHLVDAYQELLDHVVYLAAWLDERGITPSNKDTIDKHGYIAFCIQTQLHEQVVNLLRMRAFIARIDG